MKRRHSVFVTTSTKAFRRKFWTIKRAKPFFDVWSDLVGDLNPDIRVRYMYTFKDSQRT